MGKRSFLWVLLMVLIASLCGCAGGESASEPPPVEGYSVLGGDWVVKSFVTDLTQKGKTVDIADSKELKEMYGKVGLSFREDGTFEFYNRYLYEGTYERDSLKKGTFLLRTETVSLYQEDEENLFPVKEDVDAEKENFMVKWLDDEEGLISLAEFNPVTGYMVIDGLTLIFERA